MDTEDDKPDNGENEPAIQGGSQGEYNNPEEISGTQGVGDDVNQVPPLETAGESQTLYMPVGESEIAKPIQEGPSEGPELNIAPASEIRSKGPKINIAPASQIRAESPDLNILPDPEVRSEGPKLNIAPASEIRSESPSLPPLAAAGEEPTRSEDAANLGPMSFYKRKNIEKGREVPGLEKDEQGNWRQSGRIGSGKERDEEGLRAQRSFDMNSMRMPSGPLAVDLQPDIIPEIGSDGPSSFRPQGQGSDSMQGSVESAADSVDTLSTGIIDVLTRLTINMKKANDTIRQLMDKLEVEDHRDEF